jgi:hypothetical protein
MSLRKAAGAGLILVSVSLYGQISSSVQSDLQQKLTAEITLTKVTPDRSDIVTPGSVVVLHKDNLAMNATSSALPALNTYNDKRGKISQGFGGFMTDVLSGTMAGGQAPLQRKAMNGEKLSVVNIVVNAHYIALVLYSDPDANNIRYYGQLNFPFHKADSVTEESVLREIADVLTVEPPPPAQQEDTATQPAAPQGPALAPLAPPPGAPVNALTPAPAPLAAPAPPPATPPTIALGESRDQVLAALGQPTKVVQLGAKEIDFYPDMKITFVSGKVTDVQ